LGNPAWKSAKREHHGEHIGWDAQCSVNNPAVEIYIGIKLAADKVIVCKSGFLKFFGDVQNLIFYTLLA